MHKSQLVFSIESLQKLFDFPEDVHIARAQQRSIDGCIVIHVLSEREPPVSFSMEDNDPKKIGYAFRHPEEFQEDLSKGYIRGADSPKE